MRIGDCRSGATTGMTEQRALHVDRAVAELEWRHGETGDTQHREVTVRIERDERSVEATAVGRLDARVVLPRHHVRVGDDQIAAHREAGAVLHPVARHALDLHHRSGDALRRVDREPAVGRITGVG